ncbi:aminoglycoside phosphotransferase family protein [Actinomyces bowdenii]|uniref:aminoglycoside phosphotransferase family protein n=1 Tax=Actinomyces bowdenii TaxID=131109 RepID=UPI001FCFB7EE|nr:aminoglycoside phosphotransferase family protein [Actinomyces bowdenii]
MTVSTLSALQGVLDADVLSELTGAQVRAVRLRIKPGVSLLAGLAERSTGRTAGWARLLWPVSASKAVKVQQRAERHGLGIITRTLPDGLVLQAGAVDADPKLDPRLVQARRHGLLGDWDASEVLRYNPSRRLVLRREDGVLRIRTAPGRRTEQIHRAMGRLVPVPALKELDERWESGYYSLQELCGTTDLERSPDAEGTRRTGALLARLHTSTHELDEGLRRRLPSVPSSARRLAQTHARILEPLAPELAARTRRIAQLMPERLAGPAVLIHGDASPDQVLRDPATDRIWLTDFDRAGLGPAAADLGSYLAVCPLEMGRSLLEGYEQAGGRLPDPDQLRQAISLSELSRLAEPLRHADPHWRQAIEERICRLESAGAEA